MTKISLTLTALFIGAMTSVAAPLTPSQALGRVAASPASTARMSTASRFTTTDLVYTGTFSAQDASPAYYVFSRPDEGFIIVGGDDVAAPVLGYSTSGTFAVENMPENLRWWLGEYASAIAAASKNANGTRTFSREAARPEREPIAPIVKTQWNQGEPYNLMCPMVDDKLTYTGCVATAMAQVMKVHNWPDVGKGSHSYTWGIQTLSMNFAETPFEWDKMLDIYTNSASTAQNNAVATLMSACGISVNMNYGLSGSGAYSQNVAPALRDYFQYSVSTTYIPRNYFTLTAWENYIYGSLKNGAPIYYSGQNTSVGHAFVCDGYDADGYFHFNWGWGGVSDGYFLLMGLDPRSQGIGGSTAGYNLNQACILNAVPARDGDLAMVVMASINVTYTVNTTDSVIEVGGTFSNFGSARRSIQMGVAAVSAKGDTTVFEAKKRTLSGGGSIRSFTADFPAQTLGDGTYTIFPVVNVTAEKETPLWEAVNYDCDDPNVAYMTVENGNYSITVPELDLVYATQVTENTPFYKGKPFLVTFDLTNPNATESYDLIYVGLINGNSLYDYSSPLAVCLQPGETKTVSYQGTFSNASLGSYQLAVMTVKGSNGNLYLINENTPTVTLKSAPATTRFNVTDFSIENPDEVNCSDMNFNVGVKCTEGYMYWPLSVYVFNSTGSQNYGYQATDYFMLEANESSRQVVNLSIPTIPVDSECIALLYNSNGGNNLSQFNFNVKTNSVSVIEAPEGMTLTPQLVETTTTLTSENPIKGIEVYSLDGRRQAVTAEGTSAAMTINAAELPAGLYLLKVYTTAGTASFRFVKK